MTKPSKKSQLPDIDEIMGIAGKLFTDLRKSVHEIVENYKDKRKETSEKEHKTTKHEPKQKH